MDPSPEPQDPSSASDGVRILVVDDNQLSADSLSMLLRISGHDVQTRYDGASAVAAAEDLRPNVIILDLAMPIMNGYEACLRIREQPWGEGIAIVALSGWGPESDMPDTEAAGFNAHVTKPPNAAELLKLLADLVANQPHGQN